MDQPLGIKGQERGKERSFTKDDTDRIAGLGLRFRGSHGASKSAWCAASMVHIPVNPSAVGMLEVKYAFFPMPSLAVLIPFLLTQDREAL